MGTSYQWSRRKGTTAQHSTFVGINGELTVDTDKNTVVVHDGVKAGGYPLVKEETLSQFADTVYSKDDVYTKSEVDGMLGSDVLSVAGRTGHVVLNKNDVGLGNVDNTSDANKPVSTATQTALNAKQNTITGGATTITASNLTASRALVSDANGKVAVSAVTSTELGCLSGVTSSIQTQLNAKQATLVSGTNIKTINGTSILGSGDIVISASPTTDQVGTATAGLGAGVVGSYSLLYDTQFVTVNPGGTKAGSLLRYVSLIKGGGGYASANYYEGAAVSGTWRCMGLSKGYTDNVDSYYNGVTLWLRIV